MSQSVEDRVLKVTGSQSIERQVSIQSLWSGYGEILRYHLKGGKHSSVVVKHIQLPEEIKHPRGWNTDKSHQRKLKSYNVELSWYTGLGKLINEVSRIPQLLGSWQEGGEMLMILEDLSTAGYPVIKTSINLSETKVVLNWLAHFHVKNLNKAPTGLWEIGSYWHLETRPDEWEAMQDIELKAIAHTIDTKLNSAQYQTIIHGDAKLANFCFSQNDDQVAAVDFQYAGKGCGIKDVSYFLSSCMDESECHHLENDLLDYYFDRLATHADDQYLTIDIQEVAKEWRCLYDYAWADFYRFLDGWSPGHWKMNGYSRSKTDNVLKDING